MSQSARGPGPHFICVGPANSATTWIADHLKFHLDMWMPPIQEASYLYSRLQGGQFASEFHVRWNLRSICKRLIRNRSIFPWRDREYLHVVRELSELQTDKPDLNAYRRLFAPARGKLTGDIAPVYANCSVDGIRSCRTVLDNARVFMIARDPVQRFWGDVARHARYRVFGDADYGSLETAKRIYSEPWQSMHHFPTKLLDRWNQGLGEDRVKVFFFDDIRERPSDALAEIVTFIGGDMRKRIPFVWPGINRKNADVRPVIHPDAEEWVRQAFQEELEACAARFGKYGEKWLRRHAQPKDPLNSVE